MKGLEGMRGARAAVTRFLVVGFTIGKKSNFLPEQNFASFIYPMLSRNDALRPFIMYSWLNFYGCAMNFPE